MSRSSSPRTRVVPEVVQMSAMDCGPAVLKSVLEGFGIHVNYGRLREACQTEVDGTSIDVLEEVAVQLGLDAEQRIVPRDHLLLPEAHALPAILVVEQPGGHLHFVVVWSIRGDRVQVMDPATGRRWMRAADLLAMTFVHTTPMDATDWLAWARAEEFVSAVRVLANELGAPVEDLVAHAREFPTWHALAALDGTVRFVGSLANAHAVSAGAEAERLVRATYDTTLAELQSGGDPTLPAVYFTALPQGRGAAERSHLWLSGAVLLSMKGLADAHPAGAPRPALAPELVAALNESPVHPLKELIRLMRLDGVVTPVTACAALLLATIGVTLESLVFRALLDLGRYLTICEQRAFAAALLIGFFLSLAAIELPLVSMMFAMGRKLEVRLRLAFLAKIPRLGDRYFHSRPTSDMAHRAHSMQAIRQLPLLAFRLVRSCAELLAISVGLAWLDPSSAPLVAVVAALNLAVPLFATRSLLLDADFRVRSYQGTLARFYLDALLGVVALRAHGAERALRREHDGVMTQFEGSYRELLRALVTVEAIDAVLGVSVAVALLAHYLSSGSEPAGALLLVYWALSLPILGQEIALGVRQYPMIRSHTLRLLEPLGALEDEEVDPPAAEASGAMSADITLVLPNAPILPSSAAASIEMSDVTIRAAGMTILEGVNLRIRPGSHVAVVGPSGAGKSSLLGVLLGWHRASSGEVLVDGQALRGEKLERLRRETAWVDPSVQLWNRSMLENVFYGSTRDASDLSPVLYAADLVGILERMPNGLSSSLGEGGGLLSGGEGQRVRVARAMLRHRSRLVVLDEPFRGLDRERRHVMLAAARRLWSNATLLCVTHDVGDTLEFPRVLVVEDGRVVEDGVPQSLAASPASRYGALLRAETTLLRDVWLDPRWRRLQLRDGVLHSDDGR